VALLGACALASIALGVTEVSKPLRRDKAVVRRGNNDGNIPEDWSPTRSGGPFFSHPPLPRRKTRGAREEKVARTRFFSGHASVLDDCCFTRFCNDFDA